MAWLERELRTAEKLTSLGTLSAGIAHEIKNPLSAIDLNLRLLEAELPSADSETGTGEYFRILREEIGRLNTRTSRTHCSTNKHRSMARASRQMSALIGQHSRLM